MGDLKKLAREINKAVELKLSVLSQLHRTELAAVKNELTRKLASTRDELAAVKAELSSTTKGLKEKLVELSHPLESLIVGGIVEELLHHCYFHENKTWPARLPIGYWPKKATWIALDIQKNLVLLLKGIATRNVSNSSKKSEASRFCMMYRSCLARRRSSHIHGSACSRVEILPQL